MYKKIETVLWDKKKPEKTRVVRTTHGRRRTLKFICPPPTMRCTYNMPFSSKLLTLQGNGKHSDASFVMLYHIPDLEPNRRQKICPVAKGLMKIDFFQISLNFRIIFFSYFYVKIYIKWRKIDIQKK